MGDMADYALDQCDDMDYHRFRYQQSEIGDQEAYDLGIIDERGYQDSPLSLVAPKKPSREGTYSFTCKHCGKRRLKWVNLPNNVGWRLEKINGALHVCQKYKRENTKE